MQDTDKRVITQKEVAGYSREELLALLKHFEGPGRTTEFNKKAASKEKKKNSETFEYDFSWSWLMIQAKQKEIVYGKDHRWRICESSDVVSAGEMGKEVVVIGKKVPTQKRTMVVSTEVLKLWDETLRDKPCKAEFLTIAMERFIRELQDGKVVIQFAFDVL